MHNTPTIYIYKMEELKGNNDCGQKNVSQVIWSILKLTARKTA